MTLHKQVQEKEFTLSSDFQQENNQLPPSGKARSGALRGVIITALAATLAYLIYALFLPFDPLANKGIALLTFIGILWLTEAIHITATAILAPLIGLFIGIPGFSSKVALTNFAHPTIFVFFGGFALAATMHIQKLDKKIAYFLIGLAGGYLGRAVFMIFAVTAALSMWISNTATTAMMLPLVMGILSQVNAQKERRTFVFILLGIAYSASIGGLGTLVGSPPNAVTAKELGLSFSGWLKFGLPMMLIFLPCLIGTMYLVLRPNLKQRIQIDINEEIKWTLPRILTLVVFIATAVSWIFGKQLGKAFNFDNPDTVVALFATVAVLLLGLVSWKQVANNTDWGVLLLFGGGIALSNIMKDTGASAVLGHSISQLLASAPTILVILVVATFIVFLTEFTSNTASAVLLLPLFTPIGEQLGLPPAALVMVIGIGASCAFMMPVATPPNAIIMGTGHLQQRDMMKVGLWLNLVAIIILTLWAYLFLC